MPPFRSDDDAPWWVRESVPDEVLFGEDTAPEPPADLQEHWDAAVATVLLEPPCTCPHCVEPEPGVVACLTTAPESLAVVFSAEWKQTQVHTARMWRAAAAMYDRVLTTLGPNAAEHVGADLALMTGMHPRTGQTLLITGVRAVRDVPELADLVERGQLSDRHVTALLDEVGRWTDTPEQAAAVIRLTLDRARERAAAYGWPTPGQFKKRLQTAAILLDLTAADKRKKTVHERRGVSLFQTAAGAATLTIEGPEVPLLLAYDALRARAEAMGQLEGDERTLEQRMYDAALELIQVDADGGDSLRPTTGLDGEPLHLVVRGVEVALLMPYSVATGGDLELAEIPGYGPILPSTARELLENADAIRRVVIDADAGDVITVDDKVPGPARTRRQADRTAGATNEAATAITPQDADERPADPDDESPRDDGLEPRPDTDPNDDGGGGDWGPDPSPPDLGPSDHGAEAGPPPEDQPDEQVVAPSTEPSQGHSAQSEPPIVFGQVNDPAVRAGLPTLRRALEAMPLNDPPAPVGHGDAGAADTSISPDTLATLSRLAARKIIPFELDSAHYTVSRRLRRHLELRDRTCTFPGCHVPGKHCDVDHREPWPRGCTSEHNCHCLCRRHHRGKQEYFTVTLDRATGDTCWTTPDGRTYRRPPPRW